MLFHVSGPRLRPGARGPGRAAQPVHSTCSKQTDSSIPLSHCCISLQPARSPALNVPSQYTPDRELPNLTSLLESSRCKIAKNQTLDFDPTQKSTYLIFHALETFKYIFLNQIHFMLIPSACTSFKGRVLKDFKRSAKCT